MSIRAEGLCWYSGGPMSVGEMSVSVQPLVSIVLNLWNSRRPEKRFIEPWIQAVILDSQRTHAVPVFRVIHKRVCPCEAEESEAWRARAFTHEVLSLPERGGRQLSCTYILHESYVGSVEGNTLSVVVHASGHAHMWDTR